MFDFETAEYENFETIDGFDEYLENIDKKDKEELENLKKENIRLSELVKELQERNRMLEKQLNSFLSVPEMSGCN